MTLFRFNFIFRLFYTCLTHSTAATATKLRYLVDEDDERRNDIDLEDGWNKRKRNEKNIMHAIDQIGKCISFLLSIISIVERCWEMFEMFAELFVYFAFFRVERDSVYDRRKCRLHVFS